MTTAVQPPYSLIYQTVLGPPKMSPKDLLDHLKPYFYKESVSVLPLLPSKQQYVVPAVVYKEPVVKLPQQLQPIQAPQRPQKYSLFWCLYHFTNGPPIYSETYDINQELLERQRMADFFRNNTRCLKDKAHRLTNADIDEVVSNLITLSARKITFDTCFGSILTDLKQSVVYVQYYKKNLRIFIPGRRIYVDFMYSDEADRIALLYDPSTDLFEVVETDPVENGDNYLKMENYRSSLKAPSHYKMGELIDLAQRLGIADAPKKKENLYQCITDFCHGV